MRHITIVLAAQNHITLSHLQQLVRQGIEAALPLPLWVSAEISDLKINRTGHCYLELIEKGDNDAVPRAKVSAAIWRNRFEALSVYFRTSTGSDLAVGMKVLLKVTASYHELYGFSLSVSDIDPAYTLGDMQAKLRQTIEALRADGVWDMNRECEMPMVCQRLAVISSATAAGYRDFCNELGACNYHFEVTLFEAVMQGFGAEESIIAALEMVADRCDEFDAVVIIRGGGATTDLSCFNSYAVCSYIAQFPLAVVTGIGHDKDQSIADMVAHTALKTPTAVADFFAAQAESTDALLDELNVRLAGLCTTLFAVQNQRLLILGHATSEGCSRVARGVEMRLQSLGERLQMMAKEELRRGNEHLERQTLALGDQSRLCIERLGAKLSTFSEIVAANDPERVLSHGYSIVRIGGRAVSNIDQANIGDEAEVSVTGGTMNVKITDICKKS